MCNGHPEQSISSDQCPSPNRNLQRKLETLEKICEATFNDLRRCPDKVAAERAMAEAKLMYQYAKEAIESPLPNDAKRNKALVQIRQCNEMCLKAFGQDPILLQTFY